VLLDLLGAPDRRLGIVLVAGTKGKGSTAALLASLLAASGVRAGLYTKPHLQSYRERIRVDGEIISTAALNDGIDRLHQPVRAMRRLIPAAGQPTTFELTTALALAHFAATRCTVAVVEVGLGGRFDATNATDPHVSVITPISHDHTRELGTALRQIASEKAGVLRPGRIALIARQDAAVDAVLSKAARSVAAELREIPPLSAMVAKRYGLALRGAHQRQNAALAIAASRALSPSTACHFAKARSDVACDSSAGPVASRSCRAPFRSCSTARTTTARLKHSPWRSVLRSASACV